MRTWIGTTLAVIALLVGGAGCPPEPEGPPPPDYDGPGSEAWGDEDVACDNEDDCISGEVCEDGVCQPDRCGSGLSDSASPIGEGLQFFAENELAIADSTPYEGYYWLDLYDTITGNLSYDGSVEADLDPVLDVAGGNLLGSRPDALAVALDGYHGVGVIDGGNAVHLHGLDWQPTAIAAGDTDGDGLDELVAIDGGTEMAVCDVDSWSCEYWGFNDDLEQVDLGVGDIDGDALAEPVVLIDYQGYYYLHGSNLDADLTGQPGTYSTSVDGDHARVTVADLNGDRRAEAIVLLDGGWWGFFDDTVAVYQAQSSGDEGVFGQTHELEIDGYTNIVDVAARDTDTDDLAEVVIVSDDGIALLLGLSGNSLQLQFATDLGITVAPRAVALADRDGDSPRARLVSGPEPCSGRVMPVNLMLMPPYWADHSAGFPSAVFYGDNESTSGSHTDTISLGLHVDLGVKASFLEIFAAEFNSTLSWRVDQSITTTTGMTVGGRYNMRAMPEVYGPYYAGVVLSWGCFDAYTYEIDDPAQLVGGADDEIFVLTVPTGGSTSLWSSNRYNAMAEALGTLPVMDVPYAVGQPETYPTAPERIDGTPIPGEDLVFPDPGTYTVSDVGEVGWWLVVNESETNALALSEELGASVGVTVGGVQVGGGGSIGWGEGYSLTAGSSSIFGGVTPTLPDDPDTPEDEYASYAYTVRPLVYQQPYTDGDGNEAVHFVQTYSLVE